PFYFQCHHVHRDLHSFPTRRSSDLVIGMRMVESWGDDELRKSAGTIIDKVNAVIPPEGREQLRETALFSLSFGRGKQASQHMGRSEEHTSELQSRENLVCRLLLEKK